MGEVVAIRDRTAYKKDQEKLQYWGFSYGTIVGQTFATMYPDRVGRVAIDGVVNATDYYAGEWKTALTDSENINQNFTLECEAAGPEYCQFSAITNGTSKDILEAFYSTLADVRQIPISGLVNKEPVLATDFLLTAIIFSVWYTGLFGYNVVGDLLWNAANRNASFFSVGRDNSACDSNPGAWIDQGVAQSMIVCTDAESRLNETREDYYDYVKYLYELSPVFGFSLSRIMAPCHQYDIKPKWRYGGPWGANTSNPVLILTQTLDPITPLISAKGASKIFPGSQIVEAQGIGHTTLGYPSICAMKEIKKYFATGRVPKEHTYCPAAVKPFHSVDAIVEITNGLQDEDRYLLAAGLKIASDFPPENKALDYGEKIQLPGPEAGDWWMIEGDVTMDGLVKLQYA